MNGFNLVEAAIVLGGVIGLVIGGFWVAAATVQANNKLNMSVSGYINLYHQIRERFPPALAYPLGNDYALPTTTSQTLQLPAGFTLYDNYLITDTHGDSVSFIINSTMWGTEQNLISISIHNRPDAAGLVSTDPSKCLKFIPQLSAQLGANGPLRRITFCDSANCSNRVFVTRDQFPVPPTTPYCQRARIFLGFDP